MRGLGDDRNSPRDVFERIVIVNDEVIRLDREALAIRIACLGRRRQRHERAGDEQRSHALRSLRCAARLNTYSLTIARISAAVASLRTRVIKLSASATVVARTVA